jgi:hypothetical protein
MKLPIHIISILILFTTLSCKNSKDSKGVLVQKPDIPTLKLKKQISTIKSTPPKRNFDKLMANQYIKLINNIEGEFKTLKNEIQSLCIPSSIKNNRGVFEAKWKTRGDTIMNGLIKIDPMGHRSALYPYVYRLIKQLMYVLPGSSFLACTKKVEYNIQLTKFTEQIENIRSYIKIIDVK